MTPQLKKIAECLSESNAREIKLARCLAESLKRIQSLETSGGKQAKVIEKQFNQALRGVAEALAKEGSETAGALSQRIDGIAQALPVELSAVRSEMEMVREMAAKTTGAANIAAAEIAQRMTEIEANFPAQLAALKTEFAKPEAQAAAPQSFNPRGAYEPGEKYKPFDYVSSNGSSYIALVENPTQPPSKKSKQWMLVAARGAGGGVDSGGSATGLGTAAYRDVGQSAGNVLELSGTAKVTLGYFDGVAEEYVRGFIEFYAEPGNTGLLRGPVTANENRTYDLPDASGTIALLSQVGDRYLTSSTTSNTIGNGAKTFTVGTGLAYTPTQDITIVFNASNHMHAAVTSYNSTTGVLVVDVNSHTGSGTYAVWSVNVGGIGAGAIPSGGTTGQVLAKVSSTSYDDAWVTPTVAVGSVTGLGTGVATALAINIGTAGAPVVNGGALGTPSSGTVTNLTGTASININGTVGATTPTTGAFTTITSSSTTDATTNTTTGAVVLSGGLAVAKSVTIGPSTGVQLRFMGGGGNGQFESWTAQTGTGLALRVYHGFQVVRATAVNSTLLDVFDNTTGNATSPYLRVRNSNGDFFQVGALGDISLTKTITATGTTGAVTINKSSGAVNCAAAASSLVVTNSFCTVNSVIQLTVGTNDTTMRSAIAVAAAGSFTIYPTTAPTAETRVYFTITN
jgi:hypothetical protein